MHTAQNTTAAGEALRAMLPHGSDPYATVDLAAHTAFLVRDRQLMPELLDVVKTDPELAAGLIVALAALVDVDSRPAEMLSWLGTHEGRDCETARVIGALTEARQEYDESMADTLPPVTLESMRAMRHNAKLAGVLQPCGTVAAYGRHVSRKQKPCTRCTTARWLYDNATPEERALLKQLLDGYDKEPESPGAVKPPTWRPSCGKRAGYVAHKKAKEEPCDPCGAALRARSLAQYDKKLAKEGKVRTPIEHAQPRPQEKPAIAARQIAPSSGGEVVAWLADLTEQLTQQVA